MLLRICLILAILCTATLARADGPPVPAMVSICFVPGSTDCADEIATAIDGARLTVLVQACWLTSLPIMHALAAAKRRGVDVRAILDKSQDRTGARGSHYSAVTYLTHAGIPVWIDDAPAIAHNKVVIIDGRLTITGSFNFTKSADTRNAENVVMIDGTAVAREFQANWDSRRAVSRAIEVSE